MSDNARRVLVLRYFLEALEERGATSSDAVNRIVIIELKLREAAAWVIGWGC